MADFKIAEGYVEVTGKVDRRGIEDSAQDAGNIAARAFSDESEREGRRRKKTFFAAMFTPNAEVVRALRTGIPAVLGSPIGLAAITLGGLFAASFVGAVLSSGALMAIGAGFTALGAFALRENERVASAFRNMASEIGASFEAAAAPLVPVFSQALNALPGLFEQNVRRPLQEIFAGIGPTLMPFVQGIAGMFRQMLLPLTTPQAISGIQAALTGMAEQLPRLGKVVGDFFATFAGRGEDISRAFGHVITVLDGVSDAVSELVLYFTDMFNVIFDTAETANRAGTVFGVAFRAALRKTDEDSERTRGHLGLLGDGLVQAGVWAAELAPWLFRASEGTEELGGASEQTAEQAQAEAEAIEEVVRTLEELEDEHNQLSDSLKTTKDRLEDLEESLFDFGNTAIDAQQAEIDFEAAIDAVTESVKENKKNVDINTEAGRENVETLLDLANKGKKWLQGLYDLGAGNDELTEKTGLVREEFIKAARQMGYNQTEAEELADRYGLIPSEVKTKLEAIDKATAKINELERRLQKLEAKIRFAQFSAKYDAGALGRVETQLNKAAATRYVNYVPVVSGGLGTKYGNLAATGGIIGAERGMQGGGISGVQRVLVGEHRPEVVELPTGSRVIPSVDQAMDRGQAGGGVATAELVEAFIRAIGQVQIEHRTYIDGKELDGRTQRIVTDALGMQAQHAKWGRR